jgi:hypothetical protein
MSPITVTSINRNVSVSGTPSSSLSISGGIGVGSPHATYTHTQASASSAWVITHSLNCFPSVTVVDSAGSVVFGEVEYITANQVRVTFAAAFGGKAYLN